MVLTAISHTVTNKNKIKVKTTKYVLPFSMLKALLN